MDKSQAKQLKMELSNRLKELSSGLRNRDHIIIERTADTMDETQFATERDLAIRILDHDHVKTRLVREALGRFEDGTYGICLRCDDGISWKRLCAVPHAAFCLACQDNIDRGEFDEFDFHPEIEGSSVGWQKFPSASGSASDMTAQHGVINVVRRNGTLG